MMKTWLERPTIGRAECASAAKQDAHGVSLVKHEVQASTRDAPLVGVARGDGVDA